MQLVARHDGAVSGLWLQYGTAGSKAQQCSKASLTPQALGPEG